MQTNSLTNKKSELLLPAGDLLRLKTAILYGADAVYAGTPDMSLRTKSAFALDELVSAVEYIHSLGKKIYLTLNLFGHDKDIEKLPEFIQNIKNIRPDGLIIADPGIFNYVKKELPSIELHISTQANVCSSLSVQFWKEAGASLCVLAREVNYNELAKIREKCPDIKLETFVHGAMCMTYSGRCLLSNFLAERGANQGNCAHSCRWNYKLRMQLKDGTEHDININEHNKDLFNFFLEEERRPGEFLPIEEDMHGSYILNSKDLCLMPKLDQYLKLPIDSLKVEGRNKTAYYAGIVGKSYRMAIDDYYKNPEEWNYKPYMKELDSLQNRGYTLAFHEGRLTNLAHSYESAKSASQYEFAGYITDWENDSLIFEAKNLLKAGVVLEFVPPVQKETILLRLYKFQHAYKDLITEIIHAGQKPRIRIPLHLFHLENHHDLKNILPKYTLIRKVKLLDNIDEKKLDLEKEARKIELNSPLASYSKYENIRTELQKSLTKSPITKKTNLNTGVEGCCGKGCNGCLLFWYDEKYSQARKLLLSNKPGKMLDKNMIDTVNIKNE